MRSADRESLGTTFLEVDHFFFAILVNAIHQMFLTVTPNLGFYARFPKFEHVLLIPFRRMTFTFRLTEALWSHHHAIGLVSRLRTQRCWNLDPTSQSYSNYSFCRWLLFTFLVVAVGTL